MRKPIFFHDPQEFLDAASDFLIARKAEHNLLLGIAHRRVERAPEQEPYLSVVRDETDNVRMVAIMTPPWLLLLSHGDKESVEALADDVADRGYPVPGVMGPVVEAEIFLRRWQTRRDVEALLHKRFRIYETTSISPPRDVPGDLRVATLADLDQALAWQEAFAEDTGIDMSEEIRNQRREMMRKAVEEERVFYWEVDGEPVSMAVQKPTPPVGARIGEVYTPSEHRRRGYGSAVTAALSLRVLDSGIGSCFLFTDLDNPTSNRIYQNIGYRPVSDNVEYQFSDRA